MASSSFLGLRAGLFLLTVGSACSATVACGRVGLDAEGLDDSGLDGDIDGDLDTGFVDFDSGVRVDTSVPDTGFFFDSGIDSGIFIDSGGIDSGIRFDTGIGFDTRPDTVVPPFDTGIDTGFPFDTLGPDTIVEFDSGIDTGFPFDTDVPDTGVIFDSDFDTGFPFDSGVEVGPTDGGILCGPGGLHRTGTEICCAGFGTFSCTSPGLCIGTPLSCSSAASCKTGDVCCFSGGIGGGGSATCAPACAGPGVQLCALDSECKLPQRCRAVFGGYRICR